MATARPLWRAHLVVVRSSGSRLTAEPLADRVGAADPFVVVRPLGDARLEVDLWVEGADARDAATLALGAWSDLAALAAEEEQAVLFASEDETGEPGPGVADTRGWAVVALDLARTDGQPHVAGVSTAETAAT